MDPIHVTPNDDLKEHTIETYCSCTPNIIVGDMYPLDDGTWVENVLGRPIYVHNAWDGRESKPEIPTTPPKQN